MRDGLLIRWRGRGEALEWLRIDGGRAGIVQREHAPPAAVLARSASVTVLIPAEDVLLVALPLPVRKLDAAQKAAAFALEEQVAAPIESLQVAISDTHHDGIWSGAVIARARMQSILADLAERGLRADAVHADAACLAVGAPIRIDGDRVLLRVDQDRAFACDAGVWPQLAARSAHADADLETLDEPLELFARGLRQVAPVNLLQGEFASKHRGADALRWWKLAAALAVVALFATTLWLQLDAWRLQARLDALNSAMVQIYRERFPDAKRVPQPRAMLETALKRAGAAGDSGEGGMALLARVAPVLANQTQLVLNGAEYRNGRLELRLLANDIGALDAMRESLASSLGATVALESASARDGRVDGRISIGGPR